MITKEEFLERHWEIVDEKNMVKNYIPNSKIEINLEKQEAKLTTYNKVHGKLVLSLSIDHFKTVPDFEVFCVRFFINQTEQ